MLYEFFMNLLDGLFNSKGKNLKSKSFGSYTFKSKKFATQPIELHNTNVIYPDNKTEREIENLYAEIREMQSNSELNNKFRNAYMR